MPLTSVSRPAPTLGWVTNKNIGAMLPGEALSMINYFPRANTVDLINGAVYKAQGLGGSVETLCQWAGGSSSQLVAAANGSLFNVTGGSPMTLGSGFGVNRWQTANYGTTSGQYVCFVNGSDPYQIYNGSTLTAPTITATGFTNSSYVHINVYKSRLYLTPVNKLGFVYLPQLAIQGSGSYYDLSQFAKKGGYLMATATWTRDGGSGMDDMFVAITSEGEALIYQGSDPGTANDWQIVGVFDIGRPIGRRCFGKYRNDLAIITYNGLIPLSQVLQNDQQNIASVAISSNINPTFTMAAQGYGGNFGWEYCFYPKGTMALVNVPLVYQSQSQQYVVNTDTGAWTAFNQYQANCFCVFNNFLYYGDANGNVIMADTGDTILGQPIVASFQVGYDYFADQGGSIGNKQFQMVRPTLVTSSNLNYSYGMDVDFSAKPYFGTGLATNSGISTPWGSPWGSPWGASVGLTSRWLSGSRIGRCAAFKLLSSTTNQRISVQSIDYAFKSVGLL